MSQVQMRGLSQKGPKYSNKYMINGSVPSNLRKPHEVICCVIYIILAWAFIGSFTLGIKQANPSQFLYSTGQGFRCGFGAAQNYPYAYFYNPLINNKTVCADKCPKMTSAGTVQPIDCYYKFRCGYLTELTPNSEYSPTLQGIKVIGYPTISTVGNICLPEPSLMNKALKPAGFSLYQKVSEQHQKVSVVDIINKYYLLLVCASVAIFLSIIAQLLVRMVYYRKLLWPFFGISVILMLGISFTFLYLAGGVQIPLDKYSGYIGLAYYYTQSRYLGLSVFFFLLSMLFIIVLFLQIYRLKKQIKINQDYGAIFVPEFAIKQFLLYLGFTILFLGHWALSIFCFIELITSIKIKSQEKYLKMFTESVPQLTIQKVLAYFVVFWAIWGGYVIIGVFKTMIALLYTETGAIQKRQRKNQILQYLVIVFYHHFGSIVVSAFFVPVIGSLAEFLIWAFKIDFTKNSNINCIAKILKVFNPAVYLHLAITGNNYLTCCRASYNMIWEIQKLQKEDEECIKNIQTQKLLFFTIKTVVSLLCPFFILVILSFSLDFHKQVFEPLWIVVPSWLIGLGVVDILLYGIESQTRIRKINNILLKEDKSESTLEPKKKKRTNKIFPQEFRQNLEQKQLEVNEKKQRTRQNIKKKR